MTLNNLRLASLILVGLSHCLPLSAETDARDYFSGSPWGWGTCADESGTSYTLDGGMRAEHPRTIVLQSSGSDDAARIKAAIAQYDIIVLDGSKGVFTISSQMGINSACHKTIVGRNGAELATEFYLTDEDIAYLKSQNLEGLSSVDQYTGTLPDGTTLTCDRRAFFTKKAMMELEYKKSGVYSLPSKAGIFLFDANCENIIVRNLTLRGPGAVDIDGSDLLYDAYAKHLWVDHCTFIDSQDGALDTRGNYNTYTWNHFYYTSRSYSHAYTCGLGWVSNHSDVLHVTWGMNMWGTGCQRRLPQADDAYLHLLNNYHNCPGNAVGMTLNSYVRALVEGNFAASGVSQPLTGSGSNRLIYARDNNFSYSSTSTSVSVPYTYSTLPSCKDVPEILTSTHGAGATLDDIFMPLGYNTLNAETFGFYAEDVAAWVGATVSVPLHNLVGACYTLESSNPKIVSVDADGVVKALAVGTVTLTARVDDPLYGKYTSSMEVTVSQPNSYQSYRKWDFTSWSNGTLSDLNDDASVWSHDGTAYFNVKQLSAQVLMASGSVILETQGLKFTSTASKLELNTKGYIRFNKEGMAIILPELKKDDKLAITWKSANSSSERGFSTKNLADASLLTTSMATLESVVQQDGEVQLITTGGIYVYGLEVKRMENTTSIESLGVSHLPGNTFFTLQGRRCDSKEGGFRISSGKVIYIKK